MSTSLLSTSTILPLPSSPHCAPINSVARRGFAVEDQHGRSVGTEEQELFAGIHVHPQIIAENAADLSTVERVENGFGAGARRAKEAGASAGCCSTPTRVRSGVQNP